MLCTSYEEVFLYSQRFSSRERRGRCNRRDKDFRELGTKTAGDAEEVVVLNFRFQNFFDEFLVRLA